MDETAKSVMVGKFLVGTFDILGAKAIYGVENDGDAGSMVSLVVDAISDSTSNPIAELKNHYKEFPDGGKRLDELTKCTSSCAYADTIVLMCDVSAFDDVMMMFAYEYFQMIAIEITRCMFSFGLPIRGCLSIGNLARHTAENKVVVLGKAYAEALREAEDLEFSGTVLSEGFYEAVEKSSKAKGYPLTEWLLQLPCVVKDRINKRLVSRKKWCLDWLSDTDFLSDRAEVRQLIINSFSSHGKEVEGAVVDKVNNTETVIRLMIAHRDERSKFSRSGHGGCVCCQDELR